MDLLLEAQRSRTRVWEAGKSLLDHAANEKRELTAAEDAEFAEITAQLADQRSYIERLEARKAGHTAAERTMRELAGTPVDKRSGYAAANDAKWLPSLGEYRSLAAEQRAVGTAGAFIPIEYSARFFDQLRKKVGVLAAGPTIIPVNGAGSIKIPAVTSSVTVSTYAEAASITPSDPGFTTLTLDPRKLAGITIVDREAVEDSSPELLTIVQNSLLKDFGVALGSQLATGDGTGANLLGLLNIAGFTPGAATGTNGGSLSSNTVGFGFLADTLAAYDAANLDPDKAAWLMHARTWASVRKLTDLQGRPLVSVDPSQGINRTLWGRPVYVDNTLPINQTVGTSVDCSSIILFDPSQVVVAVSREVELVMSTDAYFATDQVGLRVTGRFDIGAPQPTAIVKTVGIRA
jgi:HK97 family phage major capsid protein